MKKKRERLETLRATDEQQVVKSQQERDSKPSQQKRVEI